MIGSPLNEDSKNIIFFQGGPAGKNWGKWAVSGTSIVMQIGGGQFRKRILAFTP